MTYYMSLNNTPFERVKNGSKTVEMRIWKPHREGISYGDHIVFTNVDIEEKIEVLVLNSKRFANFFELYKAFDKADLGYNKDEIANPEDMYAFYKKEDIEEVGVLAITIQKL